MNNNMNSGYQGYSMSKRAVKAYEQGERPLSKWTKADFVEVNPHAAKLTLEQLRNRYLILTSWHHTSKFCNETDFYSLREDELAAATDEQLDRIKAGDPVWIRTDIKE